MNRLESPWGRLYETPLGWAPSVTTVLRTTSPKPFSPSRWRQRVQRQGITAADAALYADAFAAQQGLSLEAAQAELARWVDAPLPYSAALAASHAQAFTDWKSNHSQQRGTRLHNRLETLLPVGEPLAWPQGCPQDADPACQRLLQSLWQGQILPDIAEVVSLEQELWYWCQGLGYGGSEDICYRSHRHGLLSGDWKSKDPKPYCPSQYGDDYLIQLIAYAGARAARFGTQVQGLAVNYCFTDGSPGVQTIVPPERLTTLWGQWQARLKAWWNTIGPELSSWKP